MLWYPGTPHPPPPAPRPPGPHWTCSGLHLWSPIFHPRKSSTEQGRAAGGQGGGGGGGGPFVSIPDASPRRPMLVPLLNMRFLWRGRREGVDLAPNLIPYQFCCNHIR